MHLVGLLIRGGVEAYFCLRGCRERGGEKVPPANDKDAECYAIDEDYSPHLWRSIRHPYRWLVALFHRPAPGTHGGKSTLPPRPLSTARRDAYPFSATIGTRYDYI